MKKIIVLLMFIGLMFICGCSKTITVTFDTDGGSIINSIELSEKGKIEKPEDPTKSNAIFDGWTLNGNDFSFETEVTKSITLKAKWIDAINLTLTSAGYDEVVILVPINSTYELPTYERSGYKFNGWVNTSNNKRVKSDYIYEEDTFLQASWEKKTQFAINYYNGSTSIFKDYCYEGDEYTAYTTSLTGYTFEGWFTDETYTQTFDFTKLQRTNNVYGKFTANKYKVSFAGIKDTIEVTYSKCVGKLPVATADNCTFVGWEYEGNKVTNQTTFLYTSDITLTPVFTTKSTFVIDDTTKKIVEYTVGDLTPYVQAVKDGYIFAGWYDNKDFNGEAIYVVDSVEYAGKLLYAKWVTTDDASNTLTNKVISQVKEYYMSNYKDSLVYEDLELNTTDPFYGATLTWASSNNSALQPTGVIKRTKEAQPVTLTLTIKYNNISETVEIPLTVKANIYKDIKNTKVVTAYVYTGTFNSRPVDDILLDTVDIINFSFANPQTNGDIILQTDYLTKLEKFQAKAIEKGVRIVLVLGDNGAATFSAIAHDDEARANYVANILKYIKQYNFAGVDVDWEYPTESENKYYTLMMKDIYEAVKEYDPELIVSSAIPAGPWGYPKYDLKNSAQYLDYINLMSYDMECSGVGQPGYHHTALYRSTKTYSMCSIEETVNFFNKSLSVPLEKIVIGAAFYSRYSSLTKKGGTITNNIVGKTVKYSVIYDLIEKGITEDWDDTAKAPYLFDPNTNYFYSYDNPKSLKCKCEYVKSKGVGGIMWWDYGSDPTGTLIQAIYDNLDVLKK